CRMIPHEILKKIRQIEIRTNRIVTESAARGCPSRSTSATAKAFGSSRVHPAFAASAGGTPARRSFKSPLQFRRIARGVEDREHGEGIILDRKVDGVFLEAPETDFSRATTDHLKMSRIGSRPLQRQFHLQFEFPAQPRAFSF